MNAREPLPDPAAVRTALTAAGLNPEDALRSASVDINAELIGLRGAPLSGSVPVNSTRNQLWEIGPRGQRVYLGADDSGRWTLFEQTGKPLLTPAWVGPPAGTGPEALISFCEDILSGDPVRLERWHRRSPIPPGA